ncbi:hypothetical protein V7422_18800 [Bacillus safensis]|uniref:hypothetical protein n=1 Tax=Bacillus TaxID=1386 RepID=UPI00164364D6|nr:hypothetical protein [Bacillus pumilus]
MASKAEKKESKEFATLLLNAQGVNYDDWLHDQHKALEAENKDFMKEIIKQHLQDQNNS